LPDGSELLDLCLAGFLAAWWWAAGFFVGLVLWLDDFSGAF